ncbi:MAG: tetraacyldisaccharide 4'-kinase, partial [Candidatus Krumholzibacteriota bacterium]|nr:tetraacyldisaccharide 4'-kinase [Candidatus Krumholzibacteriota bacterium]
MQIVERYGIPLRLFRRKGGFILASPLSFCLSLGYRALLGLTAFRRKRKQVEWSRYGWRDSSTRPRLISVGNLEVGGGGKTPCVLAFAEHLIRGGHHPVVVTRGYKSLAEKYHRVVTVLPRWTKP